MVQNNSGTLVKYGRGGSVGIFNDQSMFETDSSRSGIMDARSSFVRMLNAILARTAVVVERSTSVDVLSQETPIAEHLIWRQLPGSRQVEPIPPKTEWDEQVYTLEERDARVGDPEFMQKIMDGKSVRVLVNGLANQDAPQWSVWTASLANYDTPPTDPAEVFSDPQKLFALTPSYRHHVEDFHERDLLVITPDALDIGDRVRVDGVSTTNFFWTIWEYRGPSALIPNTPAYDPEVDESGFKLVRYQTYRTHDFWDYADWYAEGYSASEPPVVTYETAKARDIAENPVPKTTFVKIADDGTGKWIWTAFVDTAWVVVARQSGTIKLSSKLYENGRAKIGFDPIHSADISKFANRDGGWELRVLMNAVRESSVLTDLEINELFFSMVHFVHAQQDQVSWAFKTSFLSVGGYNEALRTVPVQPVDNTQNLLDFIQEVKPYRVKTREFTRVVTPQMDIANATVSDFDFPLYYDNNIGTYRTLSLGNPNDLQIIKTTRPWSDWYANYQKSTWKPEDYEAEKWNPVRHFRIRMHFDRVDHMPLITQDEFIVRDSERVFSLPVDLTGKLVEVYVNHHRLPDEKFIVDVERVTLMDTPPQNAEITIVARENLSNEKQADRIQRFYDPTNTEAAEKHLRTLMGLDFKGNVLDGGEYANNTIIDYKINADGDGGENINPDQKYFGLRDPNHTEGRPEELIVVNVGESLRLKITDHDTANNTTHSWVINNARPATDLMVPSEIGDYDARPLDDVPHDIGFVADSEDTPSTYIRGWIIGGPYTFYNYDGDPTPTFTIPITAVPYPARRVTVRVTTDDDDYFLLQSQIWPVGNQVTLMPSNFTIPQNAMVRITVWGTSTSNDGAFTPHGETRSLYVMRSDAWEFSKWSDQIGILANAIVDGDTEVTILPANTPINLIKPTTEEVPGPDGNRTTTINPGVIWVNGERIEFYQMETLDSGNVKLKQIKRGTHNTRIGVEQRHVANAVGNGTATTFTFNNFVAAGDAVPSSLVVSCYEAVRNIDGSIRLTTDYTGTQVQNAKYMVSEDNQLKENYQYSAKVSGTNLVIKFATAPANNTRITVSYSSGILHPLGSAVHEGAARLELRPDRFAGGETFYE